MLVLQTLSVDRTLFTQTPAAPAKEHEPNTNKFQLNRLATLTSFKIVRLEFTMALNIQF